MTEAKPSGRVVIAGGTGYLGLNLAQHLGELGCDVLLLSRHAPAKQLGYEHAVWDGRSLGDWTKRLEGAAALVNLAGRTVDCVKTPDHVDQILRSRVEATRVLGEALRTLNTPPRVWVQMSTAHRYGDSEDIWCDEKAAFGYGLAPFVGEAWEATHASALLPDMRSVVLRTSFVLGRDGGALPRLAGLVRWGLGGRVGKGRQGISWIHERDMNRIFTRAIAHQDMRGAYLASAPQPISNAEFMRELRKVHRMPIGLPAAGWMMKLGAPLLMRTDPDLALYGRYCVPSRLIDEDFVFEFSTASAALSDLYGRD